MSHAESGPGTPATLALLLRRMWPVVGVVVQVARPLAAQTLSVSEALARADKAAYANRIAEAQARTREGEAAGALRGLLPGIRVEGGYVRTADPLGAFGATLRQRAVTPSAFAPERLNDPASIGNLGSALVIEQPLFNADAGFGRRAAARSSAAGRAAEAWTRSGTQVDVIHAYYGAVLAQEQVAALDTAARAARAHQRVAESQHRNGLATKSDALLAAVRAGQVDARLIAARGAVRMARARLALALGEPGDTGFVLPDRLPDPGAIIALAGADAGTTAPREDVRAARLAAAAAAADHSRATALLLPRINSFGRVEWNSAGSPFGGREAWTAGILVSWSPFTGGAELAERRATAARRAAADAEAEAADARGRLELEEAANALEVALARLAIDEQAVGQSGEAHRIVARKYEGGLATAVELFDAAAEETAARLGFAEARYDAIVAVAERRRAGGQSLAVLTTLDHPEP
jgi:outer membrane protein